MGADTRDTTLFAMPSLGADMTEGRIAEWLVEPGDHVERGQIVVVVATDKSDIEVEVFEPARVIELLAEPGDVVPVGDPIAVVEPIGARPAGTEPTSRRTEERARPAGRRDLAEPAPRVTSPVIRHLATELHVDPDRVHGTGRGGRVHRDDVEAAANVPDRPRITPRARRLAREHGIDPATGRGPGIVSGDDVAALVARADEPTTRTERPAADPVTAMRRRIAELMTRSWHEIPHFHVSKRLDLTTAAERLSAANAQLPVADRLLIGAVLLAATARAAGQVPGCNGWWTADGFEPASTVDVGVVLSVRGGGLIVPTIERADQLTVVEVMARMNELVQRVRQRRLRGSDLGDASITVTNLGDQGADSVTGVIHPPQVALVGFGAPHEALWVDDGQPVARPTVEASVAGDHRAIDGLTASRLLSRLQRELDSTFMEER